MTDAILGQSRFDLFNAADFVPITSVDNGFDYFASTATEAIIASCKWYQSASIDSYIGLIRSAALGTALHTPFQLRSFLDFLGVNAPAYVLRNTSIIGIQAFPAVNYFRIHDGACQQAIVVEVVPDFWREIGDTLANDKASAFDIQNLVRDNLRAKLRVRTRLLIALATSVREQAPSTHEWVHSFVLWTGISPPVEVSGSDVIDVHCAQKPRPVENYRDFLCRQKDRTGGARTRHSRSSRRNCSTRRSQNRHFVGCRNFGRGAFRRAWANCQDAWYQAA
jgi:hypothetical protein